VAKGLSSDLRKYSTGIVGLFLVVEAISVYFLWALNPTDALGEGIFAIFLAIDLVSFAVVSYIYRSYKSGAAFNRYLLITACAMIVILIYSSLIV
jgi:hypothetical protein